MSPWPSLGENEWPTLGENLWPSLGENDWPILGENLWPIIARKMTHCIAGGHANLVFNFHQHAIPLCLCVGQKGGLGVDGPPLSSTGGISGSLGTVGNSSRSFRIHCCSFPSTFSTGSARLAR